MIIQWSATQEHSMQQFDNCFPLCVAEQSRSWACKSCPAVNLLVPHPTTPGGGSTEGTRRGPAKKTTPQPTEDAQTALLRAALPQARVGGQQGAE